jgi:hypothetical protein
MMSVASSAIQKNQKQSINAKKLPPNQKNCVSMQNVVNFVLKKYFSQKFGEWRLFEKGCGIVGFKIQYYSSANSGTVILLTQSLE